MGLSGGKKENGETSVCQEATVLSPEEETEAFTAEVASSGRS